MDAGIDVKVEWLTADDDLVCDEYAMNNHEVREIGDEFPCVATEPPQHPKYWCVMAPIINDRKDGDSGADESKCTIFKYPYITSWIKNVNFTLVFGCL